MCYIGSLFPSSALYTHVTFPRGRRKDRGITSPAYWRRSGIVNRPFVSAPGAKQEVAFYRHNPDPLETVSEPTSHTEFCWELPLLVSPWQKRQKSYFEQQKPFPIPERENRMCRAKLVGKIRRPTFFAVRSCETRADHRQS